MEQSIDVKLSLSKFHLRNPIYEINVTLGKESWHLTKQYSDFQKLRNDLCNYLSESHASKMPGPKLFLYKLFKISDNVNYKKINHFIHELIQNSDMFNKSEVQNFFGLKSRHHFKPIVGLEVHDDKYIESSSPEQQMVLSRQELNQLSGDKHMDADNHVTAVAAPLPQTCQDRLCTNGRLWSPFHHHHVHHKTTTLTNLPPTSLSSSGIRTSASSATVSSETPTSVPVSSKFSLLPKKFSGKLLTTPTTSTTTNKSVTNSTVNHSSTSSSGNVSNFSQNSDVASCIGDKDARKPKFSLGAQVAADVNYRTNNTEIKLDDLMKPSDFEFLKVIGKGSFGKVLLAKKRCFTKTKSESTSPTATTFPAPQKSRDDLGGTDHQLCAASLWPPRDGGARGEVIKYYAIKVLDKELVSRRNETRHVMAERDVLVRARGAHPFLVQFYASFTSRDKLFFVLDYVNGGELFLHLQREKRFCEPKAKFYCAEIACALGYLHSLDIIYRDLKPENILLDRSGHIKLTDFGLCKHCPDFDVLWALNNPDGGDSSLPPPPSPKPLCQEQQQQISTLARPFESSQFQTCTWKQQLATTFCGTPEYLAPEILSNSKAIRKQQQQQATSSLLNNNSTSPVSTSSTGIPPLRTTDNTAPTTQWEQSSQQEHGEATTTAAFSHLNKDSSHGGGGGKSSNCEKPLSANSNTSSATIYYYDRRVDWWCLGAVMYEMLFGLPPFYSRDTSKMYRAILSKPLTFPHNEQHKGHHHHKSHNHDSEATAGSGFNNAANGTVSPQAKNILRALLEKDRENRLGSSKRDILEIQEHPFFSDIDWEALLALKVKPPYDPSLRDTLDFRHIDSEFIDEPIPESYKNALLDVRWGGGVGGGIRGTRCTANNSRKKSAPSSMSCKQKHQPNCRLLNRDPTNPSINNLHKSITVDAHLNSNHEEFHEKVKDEVQPQLSLVVKNALPLVPVLLVTTATTTISMPNASSTDPLTIQKVNDLDQCEHDKKPFDGSNTDNENNKKDSGFYCEYNDEEDDSSNSKVSPPPPPAPATRLFRFGSDPDEFIDLTSTNLQSPHNDTCKDDGSLSFAPPNETCQLINNKFGGCGPINKLLVSSTRNKITPLPFPSACNCHLKLGSTNFITSTSPAVASVAEYDEVDQDQEDEDFEEDDLIDEFNDSFKGFSFIQNSSFDYEC